MARRKTTRTAAAPSGVTDQTLSNIDGVMAGGGQVMLGAMKPVNDEVAVAHDGNNTLAMLRRRTDESVVQLLQRLDTAIGGFYENGKRTDEINTTQGNKSFRPNAGTAVKTAKK